MKRDSLKVWNWRTALVYFVLDLIYLIKRSTKLWINYFEYKALEAPRGFTFSQRHQGKLQFIQPKCQKQQQTMGLKVNETKQEMKTTNTLHQQLIPERGCQLLSSSVQGFVSVK